MLKEKAMSIAETKGGHQDHTLTVKIINKEDQRKAEVEVMIERKKNSHINIVKIYKNLI